MAKAKYPTEEKERNYPLKKYLEATIESQDPRIIFLNNIQEAREIINE